MKKILLTLLAAITMAVFPIVISYSQTYDKPGNWGIFYNRVIANVELAGGEVASDSLVLTSTHHATKGNIRFGTNGTYFESSGTFSNNFPGANGASFNAVQTTTAADAQMQGYRIANATGAWGGVVIHSNGTSYGSTAFGLANSPALVSTGNLLLIPSFGDFQNGSGYLEFRVGGYSDGAARGRIMPTGEWWIGYLSDQGNYRAQINGNTLVNGVLNANNVVSSPGFVEGVTTSGTAGLNAVVNTHYFFNGSATTWTLPAVPTAGSFVRIKNIGTGALTVNSNGGLNTIFTSSAVNTTSVPVGSFVTFVSNGSLWGVE